MHRRIAVRVRAVALAAGVTFLPTFLGAQAPRVEVGLRAGPNRSLLVGGGETDSRVTSQMGLFVEAPVAGALSIRPEVVLSRKSFEYYEGGSHCPADWLCAARSSQITVALGEVVRPAFTWLELPVLAAVRLPEVPGVGLRPQLLAGPFVALRLGGVHCDRFGYTSVPDLASISVDGMTRSSCDGDYQPDGGHVARNGDAGFVLGGVLRHGAVGIGVRWTRSLVAALEASTIAPTALSGGRHSTLSLTVELARPVGR